MKPTREVKRATEIFLDEYLTHTDFGSPDTGGYDDQPAEWVEAMACIKAAYNKAKGEIEAAIQEKQRKAAEKRNKSAKRR